MSGTDALAVMNSRNDGYGYGDGMYGGWFWIIIILFAFGWGNNGFGNGNNDIARESTLNSQFTQRDIFNTNQNVSTTGAGINANICDTKYDLGTQILENRYNNQLCCCNTQKEILESRYTTQLGFQNAQSDLAQCCCDLKTAIHAEGEATRAQMQNDKIEELRASLNNSANAYNNLQLANSIVSQLRPYPTPSYLTCSPYMSSFYAYSGLNNGCGGCGCGNTTII